MNLPEPSLETAPAEETIALSGLPPEPDPSMQEYYKLLQDLYIVILVITGVVFFSVWVAYSLNIALNYLIGACTGVVYLRMLAKNVEQLGRGKKQVSNTRLALLIGLILVASRWNQLQIMPIFLGFLTYKAAVIFHMLRTVAFPGSR